MRLARHQPRNLAARNRHGLTEPGLAAAAVIERPPERLLASGMLCREAVEVVAAFGRFGLREQRRLEDGEWAAVELAA